MTAATARRWTCITIFTAGALALAAKPEKNQQTQSIDVLLRRYDGSLPPIELIQAAGKKPGAIAAVRALLRSTIDKDQQAWQSAIESLGIIANLENPEGYHVCEDLDAFMHGSASFHEIKTSPDSREFDKRARLAVPLALGHMLSSVKYAQPSSLVDLTPETKHDCSEWSNFKSAQVPRKQVEAAAAYLLDTLEQVAMSPPAKAQWCKITGETETQDRNCRAELQLNALQGLSFAGSDGARQSLQNVLVKSNDQQVLSLAKSFLDSFPAQ